MQIRPTAGGGHAQVREVILVANANASGVVARGGPDRVARAFAALGAHVELVRTRTPDEMAAVWEPAPGRRVTHHLLTPSRIVVDGQHAYDYGTYEIAGERDGTTWGPSRGKYVVVWRRQGDSWRMQLDIWNSIAKPES